LPESCNFHEPKKLKKMNESDKKIVQFLRHIRLPVSIMGVHFRSPLGDCIMH
jgi:hypothetical protein